MADKPWLKNYPQQLDWAREFKARPLFELLEDSAKRWPDNAHMAFMGREVGYRESADLVRRAAKGFQALGVKKGVRVGLFLPNCPQFIIAYYGILRAGGTVVNFSPLYSVPELLAQVEDSETDIMVTLDLAALYPQIAEVFDQSRLKKLVVAGFGDMLPFWKGLAFKLLKKDLRADIPKDDDHVSFEWLVGQGSDPAPVEIDPYNDVAVLQYTGGTTGVPKGAMLTHANLSINCAQTLYWDPSLNQGEGVMLGALPLFHVFAMTLVMNASTLNGAKIVLMPKFELEDALRLAAEHKVTMMPGVPTMFTAILNHDDLAKYDLSALRSCFSGGAPLPAEVKKRFEAAIPGVVVNEGYGLTESSPTVSANPIIGKQKAGSIGLPVPGTEIVILDRDDPEKVLGLGDVGEICVRGPQVMKGYWNKPEATAEVMQGDLLRTGDIGYMDEEGYTFIIDRSKDLILVGGFNVFPRNVEEAIYKHPSVAETTVIGVPDAYRGEAPKAFVVLKKDHELSAEKLKTFLREHLGKHELPREIEFRDALPKTMVGKLSKKELVAEERAKYEAEMRAGE
ncbi:dicarboxylate--CoA ligase PimA [Iodidimonas muriae]|uniref:Dicarboxylate--CoA ligase PimA n=1 Tax=Iodidimonas muriae TaxID=261467 RepID=A0ABQ2LBN0_9PROT|nr:long-chain fatty acid--CoA ligase [Iodidimonas muriae]GGO09156.1 dicarboxylate--CoA ligase PimA [Iodidimonas muriae]